MNQSIMDREEIKAGFGEMFNTILKSAKNRFKKRHLEIKDELEKFKNKSYADIDIYSQQLSAGLLSESQYRQLISDNMIILQMKSLTQAGISAIELDKFSRYILNKILKFTFSVVLPALLKVVAPN